MIKINWMGKTVDGAGLGRKVRSVLDMLSSGCLVDIQVEMFIRLKPKVYSRGLGWRCVFGSRWNTDDIWIYGTG